MLFHFAELISASSKSMYDHDREAAAYQPHRINLERISKTNIDAEDVGAEGG
jgi:hypothetical protein